MTRPGVDVQVTAAPARRGLPTDTGKLFLTAITERGPVGTAVTVTSVADMVTTFGDRVSYGAGYDYAEAAFANGVAEIVVSRVPGPAPVLGSLTRMDKAGSPVATLRFDALTYGSYASRIKVQIAAGSTSALYTVVVLFDDVEVERYEDLANPGAAVTALASSSYVRAADLASGTSAPNNNPSTQAATALTGGTDDHSNVTETQWTAALLAFGKALGPGQVAAAGRTTAGARAALIGHAKANNRTALLDAPDGTSATALIALRNTDKAVSGSAQAAMFAPWVTIPGLTGDSLRTVQPSAVAAGLIAKSDASRSTNQAAAGDPWGYPDSAVGLTGTPFTDAERESLNAAGINAFRMGPGGVQLYGFRTISDDANWVQLTWARLRMELQAELTAAAEQFVFRQINPGTIGDFRAALLGVLHPHFVEGALFGVRPEDAYDVDTGGGINTPTTLNAGELHARSWAVFSPFGERVVIDVTKSLIPA